MPAAPALAAPSAIAPAVGDTVMTRTAKGASAPGTVLTWDGQHGTLRLDAPVGVGAGLWVRLVDGEGTPFESRVEVLAVRGREVDVELLAELARVPGRRSSRHPLDGQRLRCRHNFVTFDLYALDASATGLRGFVIGRQPPLVGERVVLSGPGVRSVGARVRRVARTTFGRTEIGLEFVPDAV